MYSFLSLKAKGTPESRYSPGFCLFCVVMGLTCFFATLIIAQPPQYMQVEIYYPPEIFSCFAVAPSVSSTVGREIMCSSWTQIKGQRNRHLIPLCFRILPAIRAIRISCGFCLFAAHNPIVFHPSAIRNAVGGIATLTYVHSRCIILMLIVRRSIVWDTR